MKSFFLSLLFFGLLSISTNAQQSIGFSDSTDFQYLIDYRLPDWGFSNFYISSGNFHFGNEYYHRDMEPEESTNKYFIYQNRDSDDKDLYLNVSPRYTLYQESEDRILDLNLRSTLGTHLSDLHEESQQISTLEPDTINYERNSSRKDYSFEMHPSVNFKHYLDGKFFVQTSFSGQAVYNWDHGTYTDTYPRNTAESEYKNISRQIVAEPGVGIGIGRIRNVGPVIRAIRLKERNAALNNTGFGNEDIISAAHHFTRYQGYQARYDRSKKYFWEALNNSISGKLDGLNPYDFFYLNEVFNENLGTRLEGAEASIGAKYYYFNRLDRDKDLVSDSLDRNFQIQRRGEFYIKARWYKNLNLYHQIGATVFSRQSYPVGETRGDWDNRTTVNISWLWNFADRFLAKTNLLPSLTTENFNKGAVNTREFDLRLQTDISYFIENVLEITGGFSVGHYHQLLKNDGYKRTSRRLTWTIRAGVKYYFNRRLF